MVRLLTILLTAVLPLIAQPLRFEHIGQKDGLPQNTVSAIMQDREGFLWFGTWDGLARYDGIQFVTFRGRAEDSTSLSNNNICGIHQDSSGYLWVLTQHGLNRMHPRTGVVQRFLPRKDDPSAIPSLFTYGFFQARNGSILFPTANGLSIFDTVQGRFTTIPIAGNGKDSAIRYSATSVVSLSGDSVWISTGGGLALVNLSDRSVRMFPVPHPHGAVVGILQACRDAAGNVWCVTYDDRLLIFDLQRRTFSPLTVNGRTIRSEAIRNQFTPDGTTMWLITYDRLLHFSPLRWMDADHPVCDTMTVHRHDPHDPTSLNAVSLLSYLRDRSGVTWVGTSSGLNKAVPIRKNFHAVTEPMLQRMRTTSSEIVSFERWGKDSLWIGTREGINLLRRSGDTYRLIKTERLSHTTVLAMTTDRSGNLLAATRNGLYVCDRRSGRFSRRTTTSPDQNGMWRIFDLLFVDSMLWAATNDGVFRTADPRYEQFERVNVSRANRTVFQFLALRRSLDGRSIFLCSNADGLYRYDLATDSTVAHWSATTSPVRLGHSIIMDMAEEKDGTLWVATYGGGLDRMTPRGDSYDVRHITEADGLANDQLYCILPDGHGRYWLSSNKGLTRIDPSSMMIENFNAHDGLPCDEFNQNAHHRDDEGRLLFGGVSGFVEFHPDEIGRNMNIPPVVVTELRIFEHPRNELLAASPVLLDHTQNFLSFGFASLGYDAPLKNRCRYRLRGVSDQWTIADGRLSASFANLAPGDYEFQVIGSNNDDVWNMTGASVTITILPPWWGTVWFRSLSAIAVIASVAGGGWSLSRRKYLANIAELKRQQALLEERHRTRQQVASDLHDDVASTISSIAMAAEMTENRARVKKEELQQALRKITGLSRNAKESMEEVVWSLSPKNDTLDHLVNRIGDLAVQWCADAGVQCRLDLTVVPPGTLVDALVRKNIYLIFKEAVANALRHAAPGEITVTVRWEEEVLDLQITDDGKGFDPVSLRKRTVGGNGMTNLRERASAIDSELTVTSVPRQGTTILLRTKIAQVRH